MLQYNIADSKSPQTWDAGTDRLYLNPSSATTRSITLVRLLNLPEYQFSHLLYVQIGVPIGLGWISPEADPQDWN